MRLHESIRNERGSIMDSLMMIGAMSSLALLIVIGGAVAFGFITGNKLQQIVWVMRNQGQQLTEEQHKVYLAAEDHKKKYERMIEEQESFKTRDVNKVLERQKALYEKKKANLLSQMEKLENFKKQIEEEKEQVVKLRAQVEDALTKHEKQVKAAYAKAHSEGVRKMINIFKNMEPEEIAKMLTDGQPPKDRPEQVKTAATYISQMKESQAAEVLSAMNDLWRAAIEKQVKLP